MTENNTIPSPIIFYCKDCEEIVQTERFRGQYVYKCKKCGTKNVAFGTEKSIRTFFKLDDKPKKKKEIKEEIQETKAA